MKCAIFDGERKWEAEARSQKMFVYIFSEMGDGAARLHTAQLDSTALHSKRKQKSSLNRQSTEARNVNVKIFWDMVE